jgi:hypothetical protein
LGGNPPDGDIEEGTEEEISRLLKKPNQTECKQALSATIFERAHAQYCKTEEIMPIRSHFSYCYGKAVAILEYQGGKAAAFIPGQQDYKYQACTVIDEETVKSMEYRDLLKDPKHRETWSKAAANEHGRLFNGVGKNADGTQRVTQLRHAHSFFSLVTLLLYRGECGVAERYYWIGSSLAHWSNIRDRLIVILNLCVVLLYWILKVVFL